MTRGNDNSYTFNSLDSPKVLMGPNLGTSPKTNPFKFTKNTSKSVEVLDLGRRRASLDDKSLKASMAKSTSSDYDVWQGVYRDVDQRRGSLPRGQLEMIQAQGHSASSGVVGDHMDDERFSWKGSFESALAADPRTRLSIEAKRRSIGSDCNSEIFSSVEQMGSKSSLVPSRSPSQSSKRSLKSSLPNSRSSLHMSRSEKDIAHAHARGLSELSSTPTSEVKHESDSDDQSLSSSVRSSVSSRYGRRSSVPETQILARLSEDSPPRSPSPPPPVILTSTTTSLTSARQHSTNSLPRLGTSSIQKTKTSTSTLLNSSSMSGPSQPSNIATSTQGGVRSARYRPHGYKPPPTRKMSPASGGPARKSSTDSLKFNDDGSEFSSKSGTPSPMVARVNMLTGAQTRSTSDLLRDYRETSVASSRGSSDITEPDNDNTGLVATGPGGHNLVKAGSLSSLGTRSESMASVYSQGEGRYGTVTVKGDLEFGFIYNPVSGSLDINIKQCRDLAARLGRGPLRHRHRQGR